ncbi:MAG TPA: hypothetical protein VGF48_14065 [Thermoanaerobaculia bacterium]|jgi:hypothetical protein
MRTTAVLLFALVVSATAFAQTPPPAEGELQRVLIPISVSDVPGANGSLWTSELWAVNGSEEPGVAFALPCALAPDGCGATILEPDRSVRLPNWGTPQQPGVLLLVSDPTSLTLHVRDKSRNEQSWGAEIPVVDEDDFFDEVSHMTGIPAGPAWRHTLRIYSISNTFGIPVPGLPVGRDGFIVRLYAVTAAGDQLLREREYLIPPHAVPPPNQIPSPLGQFTITDLFAGTAQHERLRVSIEPFSEGFSFSPTPYWAFVSVTNNESQQFTTVVAK